MATTDATSKASPTKVYQWSCPEASCNHEQGRITSSDTDATNEFKGHLLGHAQEDLVNTLLKDTPLKAFTLTAAS